MTRSLTICVAFLLFAISHRAQTPPGATKLVRIWAPDWSTLENLVALNVDFASHDPELGWQSVILYGHADEQRVLAHGFTMETEIADLRAHIESGLAQTEGAFPALGTGSMGGWFTFDEIVAAFDQLAATYPALVAPKQSLGLTHEGRDLWMWKISDNVLTDENEPEVELDALHHAREPGTAHSLLYFCTRILESYGQDPESTALIDHRELYVIPCVNPDGYVFNQTTNPLGGGLWRKNRRNNGDGTFGVDLNRNYGDHWGADNVGSSPSTNSQTYRGPSPMSEPEVQAIAAFAATRQIRVAQNAHTYSGFHLYPFGWANNVASPSAPAYQETCQRMSSANGYRVGTVPELLYLSNGGSTDWWEATHGTLAITTEMGSITDGFWPPTARILTIAIDNFPSFHEWAWFAGSDVRWQSRTLAEVVGNGNAFPEPGETFDVVLTLRNLGLDATTTPISMTVSAATPYCQIVAGANPTLGAVGSRQDLSFTVRILIGTDAPFPSPIDLALAFSFDGISRSARVPMLAGVPATIFADDFESDQGWSVGSPEDIGTGAWVRVDPNSTTFSGVTWQTGDDSTPAPGTRCFVTGNGTAGGSPQSSDCDGRTTLTSPLLDLSGWLEPTLEFQLWFTNDDQDDAITLDLSNDAGATWTRALEVRGRRNFWTPYRVRISDYLVPSNQTQWRFRVEDVPETSITEGAIDDVVLTGYPARLILALGQTAPPGGTLSFSLQQSPPTPRPYAMSLSFTALTGLPLGDGRRAGIDDSPLLLLPVLVPSVFENFIATLDANGSATPRIHLPLDPLLSGLSFYLAGLSLNPLTQSPADLTGTLRLTIP